MSNSNSIQLSNIQLSLGSKQLFSDLSVNFHAGQHTALLGANGAGKSSLLKLICGDRKQHGGEINILGQQREAWDKPELSRHLAVLPQSSELSFAFSVSEVVALGLLNSKLSYQQQQVVVKQQLELMDIWHYRDTPYPQLSGGEKQRVHYARVTAQLATTPVEQQILLLDEPTSALDLSHQQVLMEHASKLSQQGATVISVVHDLNLASRYCQRILLLKHGEMCADGEPEKVLTQANIHQVFDYQAQILRHPEQDFPVII
ncbi:MULTISPECIES: heme ABC transporter ATP-binding protein [unclassified Agarivorans]|uniref:heme ABC transporter ATP-binding protein n=1 Tax=unclassified Agarivorans TaxID=2636026 RepID=UPI0010E2AA2E|nr:MULTISPECIES: heme ABC transporter ATP-binding protein [unclassified Agarivorans]MDO6762831.1 heme ABC transporter ATP-binding protein [Agarivorans sp. 1_MG-2023]GDY24722.1 hemin import ATP-binding protein HmuV [Agarivorans sp. Toyoura001]